MKLIDADLLEPDTEWNEYEDGFMSYSKMQINAAETIKAIPIDKVEQIMEEIDLQLDEIGAYDLNVAKTQRYIRDNIRELKENKE